MDSSPEACSARPELAGVEAPLEAIGSEAVRVLMRLFEGAPVEQCRVAIPVTEFKMRGSVGPVSAPAESRMG